MASWRSQIAVFVRVLVLTIPVVCLSSTESHAAASDLEARRQQLFSQILLQPNNLDASFEYAAISTQLGDFEGAIATLERMLIYAPGLPRVQLELGVLYFRLGSYQTAASYFNGAISGKDVPDEVRTKVSLYLDAIGERQDGTKLTASVYSGVRWQTNANFGPGSQNITLNDLPFVLDQDSTEQKDYNVFAAANFHLQIDLANQGDRLEADLLVYGAHYNAQTQLDTELAEFTFGPSFNLRRIDIDNTYLGIYGIANGIFLDDTYHFGTAGVGMKIASNPTVSTKINLKVEYREKRFNNTTDRPTSKLRDGFEARGVASMSYRLTENLTIDALIRGTYEKVDADFFTHKEYGGSAGLTYQFGAPFNIVDVPWAINVTGGYIRRDYDSPDPTIDETQSQIDKETFARATLSIGITSWLALMPQVEIRKVKSNYDIRNFENRSALLGLLIRF